MARKARGEFGDFQTPEYLAQRVCEVLHRQSILPATVVEPTCGSGSFLRAAVSAFSGVRHFFRIRDQPGSRAGC